MHDLDELFLVMRDALLDGDAAAQARLGAALAERLGAAEAGYDTYGPWMRIEVGGASQRMRWRPPGRFLMGSPASEACRYSDEGPVHEVTLTRGFWIGETPVTQALYQAITGDNPSQFRSPDRPVERVRWYDAEALCEQLSERFARLRFRLPTEAEWEYACRAGTHTATWAGELDLQPGGEAPILDAIAWYGENSARGFELPGAERGSHPVGRLQPNPAGLYDMLGNVWDWCADQIEWQDGEEGSDQVESYRSFRPEVDPIGTEGSLRVIRGGGWLGPASSTRAACRYGADPDEGDELTGLRLVAEPG